VQTSTRLASLNDAAVAVLRVWREGRCHEVKLFKSRADATAGLGCA
jgi:hypothetical protein